MCKPKFKKFNWFVKLITLNWPAAITLSPFGIYINQKYYTPENINDEIKNHELIHWEQQLEMGVIFFYLWYFIEWLIKLFIYGKKSYMNISFERESYGNENNFDYLKTRKHYSWFKYI